VETSVGQENTGRMQAEAPQHDCSTPDSITLQEIWHAIEEDQFAPHFQPKVKLRGMELAGVEALMRWHHPKRGLLTAGAFLPLIEDNFLFDELTTMMLEKSIQQCLAWLAEGLDVPVSVNLSPDVLRDQDIAERIEAKLRKYRLAPSRLVIEVSEAAVAHDIAGDALENLVRLRVKGFGIAIDDYGTGHCDRRQLERVPASELKIDRKMLAGAAVRPPLRALLQQSLDIARELNLASVAEGIENQEEWNLVNELGCDMAQGFLIARPMAGADLVAWSQLWSSDPFL
jgi:EAL domain-containing protein (putative c-di-GMP-specific phosphodiesterase class I)